MPRYNDLYRKDVDHEKAMRRMHGVDWRQHVRMSMRMTKDGLSYESDMEDSRDYDIRVRHEDGQKHTKYSHPYSYDPFTVWGRPYPSEACNGSVYTDRLWMWNHALMEQLGKQIWSPGENHFGSGCNGEKIERLLQGFNSDPTIRLIRVIEYCDLSSGYPSWRCDYVSTMRETFGDSFTMGLILGWW